jgi:penicillin-binding protein 2
VKAGLMSVEEWSSLCGSHLMKFFSACLSALAAALCCVSVWAQEVQPVFVAAKGGGDKPVEQNPVSAKSDVEDGRTHVDGSMGSRRDARTMTLSIPAPRGLITDRNGEPLAQNKVGYYLALQFPLVERLEDSVVIEWARKRIALASTLEGLELGLSDAKIIEHYRHRRWVPLSFSKLISSGRAAEYRDKLTRGLILHPVYYRHYPEKETLAHVLGYVRSKGKLPNGPINYGDLLFEETQGVAGLEKLFDDDLTGKSGLQNIIFDSDGRRLLDEQERRPEVGNTVVTTLNLKWQKHAESVLAKSCERGAFVVLDIQTGDVLVMASRPGYDINVWIPTISQKDFDALLEDPAKPMFGRAFQASYPPASTFKPVVALAALTNGVVDEQTLIDCPAQIEIGDTTFRNHSKTPAGWIGVGPALYLSNNVWFYQVGIKTRASSFMSVARRLGFGSTTGLPLFGETAGLIPNAQYMIKTLGRATTDGDTANWSIGQGAVSASPLQVAQAMVGIANGRVLPKLRLVRQVQDPKGGVLSAPSPGTRNVLTLDSKAVEIVQRGMHDVVHAAYGTGQRGAVSFCEIAGKTGTGQWVTDRELAWFAGFLPFDNPRFAFVALYEGMPGEKVSGGRKAAPMIPKFFNHFEEEFKEILEPPSRAMIIVEEDEEGPADGILEALPAGIVLGEGSEGMKAIPVDEITLDDLSDAPRAIPVDEEDDLGSEGVLRAQPVEEEDVEGEREVGE